jgi:hypothetical protein
MSDDIDIGTMFDPTEPAAGAKIPVDIIGLVSATRRSPAGESDMLARPNHT